MKSNYLFYDTFNREFIFTVKLCKCLQKKKKFVKVAKVILKTAR